MRGESCARSERRRNALIASEAALAIENAHLYQEALEKSLSPGSQSFEQALYRLVQEGLVTQEEALANADGYLLSCLLSTPCLNWTDNSEVCSSDFRRTASAPVHPLCGWP